MLLASPPPPHRRYRHPSRIFFLWSGVLLLLLLSSFIPTSATFPHSLLLQPVAEDAVRCCALKTRGADTIILDYQSLSNTCPKINNTGDDFSCVLFRTTKFHCIRPNFSSFLALLRLPNNSIYTSLISSEAVNGRSLLNHNHRLCAILFTER